MSRYSPGFLTRQGCFSGCLFGIVGIVSPVAIISLLLNPDEFRNPTLWLTLDADIALFVEGARPLLYNAE